MKRTTYKKAYEIFIQKVIELYVASAELDRITKRRKNNKNDKPKNT